MIVATWNDGNVRAKATTTALRCPLCHQLICTTHIEGTYTDTTTRDDATPQTTLTRLELRAVPCMHLLPGGQNGYDWEIEGLL